MIDFSGRVALITGAATGIGRQSALSFAAAGADVVVADVVKADGEAVAHEVEKRGGRAIFVHADVTRDTDVEAMLASAVSAFGRVDFAFNNAGIALRGMPVAEMPEKDWDRMLEVNLKGVWLCLKHECAQMLKQQSGAIVNTSSIMGVVSGPGLSAYSASKSGVIGLTKAVALDYARSGIRVNVICPGGIAHTGITDRPDNRVDMEQLANLTPIGRLGEPGDIANAAVWLCSAAADFITGQVLTIDGGFTAW